MNKHARKRFLALASVMLASAFAFSGETWYLKTSNHSSNLTDPSHWTNSVGAAASEFEADGVYLVRDKLNARSPNSSPVAFSGGVLLLGSGGTSGQLNLYSAEISFPCLTLNRGTLAQQGYNGANFRIDGMLSVVGGNNMLRWLYSASAMNLKARLVGDSGAELSTHVRYANATQYEVANHRNEKLVLEGDCSAFAGTLKITPAEGVSSVSIGESEYFVKLVLGAENFSMPGKVEVANRCAIEVAGKSASLGSLALKSGSILMVPALGAGVLAVDESLDLVPPQRLRAAYRVPADGQARSINVLTAPPGADLRVEDFALEGDFEDLSSATLGVKTENGRKTLVLSYGPIVELVESDGSSLARASADDTSSIAWGKGSSWSNGAVPAAGTNYVVRAQDGHPMCLRTPTRNANLGFPGRSLTVGRSCFLRIFQSGTKLSVGDLRLMDGAEVDVGQNTYSTLDGIITVFPGVVRFGTCNGESLSFNASFRGRGDIWFSGPGSGTSVPQGRFNLYTDSPDFKGRMRVEYCLDNATYGTRMENVFVDSELQLGGRLDAFDAKALTLRKYGRLTTRGSFALSDDYNRGVFVDCEKGGVINVANEMHELEFTTRLTLNGRLYKEGAGTLIMGGSVRFGDGDAELPEEGKNVFVVTNGTVKVTAADAVNGLSTEFADGTRLVLAVDPGNAELVRYGIRNVKTDKPFAVSSGVKIPFSLEASPDVKNAALNRSMRIGLFTVTSKADETFRPLVPDEIRSPIPSSKGTLVRRETDGLVTYSLDIVPVGMHIIFR